MALRGCTLVRYLGYLEMEIAHSMSTYMIMLDNRRLDCHFTRGKLIYSMIYSDVRIGLGPAPAHVLVTWDELDCESIDWELIYKLTGETQ